MKNYLITGISKGLGFKIAETLLEKGNTVYGVNRTISEELLELQNRYKNQLFIYQFDLANTENVKKKYFS